MRAAQVARGENPRYDGRCRDRRAAVPGVQPVIRLRNPAEGSVTVHDLVRGDVEFNNADLDDLILVRSDGIPTFHFGVVVDDADMAITHVIRGDDHLTNTPRQINILRALDIAPPVYAHLPMILGADGARLSKRHGAVNVLEYRDQGYLPDALLNYLVRLGWSHGDQELFSRDEMIRLFDIAAVNAAASRFNPEKLAWLNQQYIINGDTERLARELRPHMERRGLDSSQWPAAGKGRGGIPGTSRDTGRHGSGELVCLQRLRCLRRQGCQAASQTSHRRTTRANYAPAWRH